MFFKKKIKKREESKLVELLIKDTVLSQTEIMNNHQSFDLFENIIDIFKYEERTVLKVKDLGPLSSPIELVFVNTPISIKFKDKNYNFKDDVIFIDETFMTLYPYEQKFLMNRMNLLISYPDIQYVLDPNCVPKTDINTRICVDIDLDNKTFETLSKSERNRFIKTFFEPVYDFYMNKNKFFDYIYDDDNDYIYNYITTLSFIKRCENALKILRS